MTTKTFRLSGKQMDRRWHVIDAKGRPLGRLASEVAQLLLGKHKPTYEPHLAMGDFVVIVNAREVALTGNKRQEKVYYRHTGYPGGLRERTFEEQLAKDPRRVVERAVKGMLPHNSRGRELFRHLKVYAGPEHPHEAQLNEGTGARAKKSAARAEAPEVAEAPRAAAPTAGAPTPAEAEERTALAEPAAETPEASAAEAAQAAEVAAADAQVSDEDTGDDERPTGALERWKRADLDAEAERLGIEIESGWKKEDVVAAIKAHEAEAESEAGDQS